MKEMLDKVKVNDDGSTTVFVKDAMRIRVTKPNKKTLETTLEMFKTGFSKKFQDACKVEPLENEEEFIDRVSGKGGKIVSYASLKSS